MGTLISYPDYTLTSTFSGGSWSTGSPVTNLLNPLLGVKARTTSIAALTLDITLSAANAIKVLSVLSHNLTYAGTIQVQGFTDSGRTVKVADSGVQYAFPQTLGSTKAAKYPKNWVYCLTTPVTAQYWRLIINDTAPNTYIEMGRVWLSPDFNLISMIEYGASLGFMSRDIKTESIGGIFWGTKQQSRRSFSGSVTNLTSAVKQDVLIMQKELGTVSEFMWVFNPLSSSTDMMLESFPAMFTEISPIAYAGFNSNDLPLSVQEIIG
jgi:hypothetical protein